VREQPFSGRAGVKAAQLYIMPNLQAWHPEFLQNAPQDSFCRLRVCHTVVVNTLLAAACW
jgi:hypothetical protein